MSDEPSKEEMMKCNGRVASPKWKEMFEVPEKLVMQSPITCSILLTAFLFC
jgi:hypothetical protein